MKGVMDELFKAAVISQTTNVLVGAVKKIHYTSRLTDTNDWYLFEVGSQMKPFIKQTRKAIEFSALEQGSEGAFMRKMFYYGVDYRIGIGYGLWQKAVKVTNT
jgi:phage major head subunit gpT-like protein